MKFITVCATIWVLALVGAAIHHTIATGIKHLPQDTLLSSRKLGSRIDVEEQSSNRNESFKSGPGRGTQAVAQRRAPAVEGFPTPEGCPAWIEQYAAFHKKTRGATDAKYLVFNVNRRTSGLGDRLRGMMFTTRLAVSLHRVVLFTWNNDPHEPDRFLPPSGDIDWRLEGIQGYEHPAPKPNTTIGGHGTDCSAHSTNSPPCYRIFNFISEHKRKSEWIKSGGLQKLDRRRFITILTNHHADTQCAGCPSLGDPLDHDAAPDKLTRLSNSAACLFRYLFRPSQDVMDATNTHLLELFGPRSLQPDFKFVGMHLRIGGMATEQVLARNKGSHRGPLADFIGGMECAKQLGEGAGINTTDVPLLLLTDHHKLREFVRTGQLTRAVTPNIVPIHIARMDPGQRSDDSTAISSYVDIALLAKSQCLVASNSGFSNTAWLLGGGKPCIADLTTTRDFSWRQHHPCAFITEEDV